jgi:hypothetical protein
MKSDERPEDRPPTPEAIVTQAHDVVWRIATAFRVTFSVS